MEHILSNPLSIILLTICIAFLFWFIFKKGKLHVKTPSIEISDDSCPNEDRRQMSVPVAEDRRKENSLSAGVHRGCANYRDVLNRITESIDRAVASNDWYHMSMVETERKMWVETFAIMDDARLILMEKFFFNNCKEVLRNKTGNYDVSTHPDLSKYIAYFGSEMEKEITKRTKGKLQRARLVDAVKDPNFQTMFIPSTIEEFFVASLRLGDQKVPFAGIETFTRADIQLVEEKNKHFFEEVSRTFFNDVIALARVYAQKFEDIDLKYRTMRGLV